MKAPVRTVPAPPGDTAGPPAGRAQAAWIGYHAVITLLQLLPPRAAEVLFRFVAALAAGRRCRAAWAQAMAANLQGVHAGALDPEALRSLVRAALVTRLRAQYEMLRYARRPERMQALAALSPAAVAWLREFRHSGRGVMLVGPHTGNFDLMGRILVHHIPGLMALVAPVERPGYAIENRIRRRSGIDIQPLSAGALRRALRHLKAGGAVVTGMDRPLPGRAPQLHFFGRPAPLAVAPVRLAAHAGVPVAVVSNLRGSDGRYSIDITGPFEIKSARNDPLAQQAEAEALLHRLEKVIRSAPGQWTMFRPLWPEDRRHDPN